MNASFEIEQLLLCWKESWAGAKSTWSPFVKLREPEWCISTPQAVKQGLKESFAMIRLSDHRIVIDMEKISEKGLKDFSMEILAHEIGHHIHTPANLYDNAKMLSRIRWGLPDIEDRAPLVANLYSDLLINDHLQRKAGLNMAEVYIRVNQGMPISKLWTFYMRTYEYLWKLDRSTLTKDATYNSPAIDADASLAAALIRSYSKNWMDGTGRFAALMYPYLMEEKEYREARKTIAIYLDAENAGEGGGSISGLTEVDQEGLAGAIDPRAEAYRAEGSDAPDPSSGENMGKGEGPKQRYLNPGKYVDLMRQVNPNANEQELIMNYYKEIALPHLVDFPVEVSNPVSFTLPEGTESWDVSDPVEDIDWIESAIVSPNIFPGYSTVKRTYGPDQESAEIKKPLDVYIGIDCSGSMNNPKVYFSWPVLAATIIGLSALRAGAKVMGCLSGEPGSFMETDGFLTSDKDLLAVLTSYLGTGYSFGVPRLEKPFGKKTQKKSHIILVTDDDIFSMLDAEKPSGEPGNWEIIERALINSGGVGTLVLHSNREWHKESVARLTKMGWHIYYVTNEQELLDFASRFSKDHYHFKSSV